MRAKFRYILAALIGAGIMHTAAALPAAAAEPAATVPTVVAQANDVYRSPQNSYGGSSYGSGSTYNSGPRVDDAYRPPAGGGGGYGGTYDDRGHNDRGYNDRGYSNGGVPPSGSYGEPYSPPSADGRVARESYDNRGQRPDYYDDRGPRRDDFDRRADDTYSQNEIVSAGHSFFGSISRGLANVIEHAFKKAGRPNGYILGEDAGGAFVAGLRYGEGKLYTKNAGNHPVYWQGPSVGYDFGGAGAKTMVLVYNLKDPSEVYHRFGGVEGSAYLVGGVSIQFQKHGDVTMAPIRAGVGLRLGANVGYLKYTRKPTWNPF